MHTFTALLAKAGQARNRASKHSPIRNCLWVPLLAVMVLVNGKTAHADGPVAIGEVVSLKTSSEGYALAKNCPRGDFEIDFEVTCNQPGSVFDTVGLNAAPVGSWVIVIAGDNHLRFSLWDGQKWHPLVSQATLGRGKPAAVRLVRQGGTARFWVDGKEDAALSMPTPLSGQPVFVGDFKGDESWGAKYNIHQSLLGSVKVLYLGEPRLTVLKTGTASAANASAAVIHGEVVITGPDGQVPGDSDGDGVITAGDALLALKISVKLIPSKPNMDMDKDNQVTSNDAMLILQKVVGKS